MGALRLVVYAANLHHGGAVGGAANFIRELCEVMTETPPDQWSNVHIISSSRVRQELGEIPVASGKLSLEIRDDFPSIRRLFSRQARRTDVAFTYRGPAYVPRMAATEIVGFADRSVFFQPDGKNVSTRRLALLGLFKRLLLHRYDGFVVQTDSMKATLAKHYRRKDCLVLGNRPAEIFYQASRTPRPTRSGDRLNAFYPARAYPHKNHIFIHAVGEHLAKYHGVHLEVAATVTSEELASLSVPMRHIVPVGVLSRAECLDWYLRSEAVFFPSLNETYSVTPLEAMALERPVVAARMPFLLETVGDHPFYYSDGDVSAAAAKLLAAVQPSADVDSKLADARAFVGAIPAGKVRIDSLFRFFMRQS